MCKHSKDRNTSTTSCRLERHDFWWRIEWKALLRQSASSKRMQYAAWEALAQKLMPRNFRKKSTIVSDPSELRTNDITPQFLNPIRATEHNCENWYEEKEEWVGIRTHVGQSSGRIDEARGKLADSEHIGEIIKSRDLSRNGQSWDGSVWKSGPWRSGVVGGWWRKPDLGLTNAFIGLNYVGLSGPPPPCCDRCRVDSSPGGSWRRGCTRIDCPLLHLDRCLQSFTWIHQLSRICRCGWPNIRKNEPWARSFPPRRLHSRL